MKRTVIALPLLLLALAVPAQETEPPSDAAPAPVPEAKPSVPAATEVPRQAETVRVATQEILNSLEEESQILEIEQELQPTTDTIEDAREGLAQRDIAGLNTSQLERIRLDWVRYHDRIGQWLDRLGARAAARQENIALLQKLREQASTIRDAIAQEDGLQPLVERLESVIAEVDQVDARVRQRLERLLAVQDSLIDAQAVVDLVLDDIDAAIEVARSRLFGLDSPPLWAALRGESIGPEPPSAAREIWDDHAKLLTAFFEEDHTGLVLHVVWIVALLLPMLYLRRRGRAWMERHSSLQRASLMLDRPISAAMVLGTLIARWTYLPMPDVYIRVLVLVILAPLLRLVTRIAPRTLQAPLYAFGVLFVLYQVEELAGETNLQARLFLLALTLASLGAAWWIARHARASLSESAAWRRRIPVSAGLTLFLLAVALVSNVVGNVGLASLLIDVVLTGNYFALLLYAGYLVSEGAVGAALVSPPLQPLRSVRTHGEALRLWTLRMLRLAFVVWWGWAMLGLAKIRDPVVDLLGWIFDAQWKVGTVTLSLGDVIAGAVALWVAVLLSRVVRVVLEDDVLTRVSMPRGVPATISMMVRYAIITVGVLFAAAAAGLDLSQMAFVVGALGVGIGFGLQNVVNNFVSGLILAFERPIRVGDTVQTATLLGEVRGIGIRASRVRTFDGAEVIVPNGSLIAGEVTNWTLSDRLRRIVLPVGVAYGSDVHRVQKLLLEVVEKDDRVLAVPAPVALFQGFGESSLDFSLRYWTADYDNWLTIGSDVTLAVHDALYEAGIEIPFPQRDLHVRSVDPSVGEQMKGETGE